jgi:Rieske Fe-S protein
VGDSDPSRREFVRRSAGVFASGALAGARPGALAGVASVLMSCTRTEERAKHHLFEATLDVSALTSDGAALTSLTEGFDGTPILVIRSSARRFVALSMQCTHEGCPVKPPVGGVITCPCHGSQYDLEGRVLHGPAQFALARYETTFDGRTGRLTVTIDE